MARLAELGLLCLVSATTSWAEPCDDAILEQLPNEGDWYLSVEMCGWLYAEFADNVVFPDETISCMRWWGSTSHDSRPVPFRIRVYVPGTGGAPGEVVYEHFTSEIDGFEVPIGGREYRTEVPVFEPAPGQPYFLSIQGYCPGQYWRWCTGDGDDVPVWFRYPEGGYPDWTVNDLPEPDVSFQLLGELSTVPVREESWSAIKAVFR